MSVIYEISAAEFEEQDAFPDLSAEQESQMMDRLNKSLLPAMRESVRREAEAVRVAKSIVLSL